MEFTGIFINSRGEIRAGWRILLFILTAVICGYTALWLYAGAAGHLSHGGPDGGAQQLFEYLLLNGAVLFAAYCMLRFVDRKPFSMLGFPRHGRIWIEAGQGLLQGFVMVSTVFLAEWGAGWVHVSWAERSTLEFLRLSGFYVALFAFAGAFEEIATRGYPFQALIQGTGKPAAVCITSLLFGLGHLSNPHASVFSVVNTMLAGLLLSLAYLKTRALWFPISLHAAWNLTLGFVYGFPVSGVPLPETVLRLSGRGPVWLTGGDYGPEGGAVAALVIALATAYLWRSGRIRPSEKATALWYTPRE